MLNERSITQQLPAPASFWPAKSLAAFRLGAAPPLPPLPGTGAPIAPGRFRPLRLCGGRPRALDRGGLGSLTGAASRAGYSRRVGAGAVAARLLRGTRHSRGPRQRRRRPLDGRQPASALDKLAGRRRRRPLDGVSRPALLQARGSAAGGRCERSEQRACRRVARGGTNLTIGQRSRG